MKANNCSFYIEATYGIWAKRNKKKLKDIASSTITVILKYIYIYKNQQEESNLSLNRGEDIYKEILTTRVIINGKYFGMVTRTHSLELKPILTMGQNET